MPPWSFSLLDSSVVSARSSDRRPPDRAELWASLTFLVFRSLELSVVDSAVAFVVVSVVVVVVVVVVDSVVVVVVSVWTPPVALQMLIPSPQDTGQRLVSTSHGHTWPLGCSPVGNLDLLMGED